MVGKCTVKTLAAVRLAVHAMPDVMLGSHPQTMSALSTALAASKAELAMPLPGNTAAVGLPGQA